MARQQRVSRGAFGSEPKWRWRCRYPSRQGKRSSAYPVQVLARSECRTEHYSGDARNVANVSSRFQRRNCHVFRVNFGCEGACCWAWHSVYGTSDLRSGNTTTVLKSRDERFGFTNVHHATGSRLLHAACSHVAYGPHDT